MKIIFQESGDTVKQDAIIDLFYSLNGDLDKINQYIDSKLAERPKRRISTLEIYIQSRLSANPRALKMANMEINPLETAFISRYPALEQVEILDLRQNLLGDDGLALLAQSTGLGQLRELDLRNNTITRRGMEILAQSKAMPALEKIDLRSNRLGRRWQEKLGESGNFPNLREVKTV